MVNWIAFETEQRFSHRGHRKRAREMPLMGYPGYFVKKLRSPKQIQPRARDPDASPFFIEFEVRRRKKDGTLGKPLKVTPKRSKGNRYDLSMCIKSHKTVYYHRAIAMTLCPVMSDEEGCELGDPFWVEGLEAGKAFEVHHADGNTHNCSVANLFVLYKAHHRALKRKKGQ